MLGDDARDKLNTATFGCVKALDQGESHSSWLYLSNHGSAQSFNELMWNDEDQDISIFGGFNNIWNSNLKI